MDPTPNTSDLRSIRLTAFALIVCLLGVSCGTLAPRNGDAGSGLESVELTSDQTYESRIPVGTNRVGLCADASPSMDPSVVRATLGDIRALADTLSPPLSASPGSGSGGMPGLELIIRRISGTSYGSIDDELLRASVRPVPGLVPRPEPDRDTYLDRITVWRQALEQLTTEVAQAEAELEDLRSALRTLDVPRGSSEIAGCVSATVESFPAQTPLTLVVVSDLEQWEPPQVAGELSSVRMVVVHHCQDAAACEAQRAAWIDQWAGRGLTDVEFVRPELLAPTLSAIVGAPS